MREDDKLKLLKECEENGMLPGFAISRMPVPLFEEFMSDVNERYAGTYWAKLQDLMRKAEAYDLLFDLGIIGVGDGEQPKSVEKDDSSDIGLMGGEKVDKR